MMGNMVFAPQLSFVVLQRNGRSLGRVRSDEVRVGIWLVLSFGFVFGRDGMSVSE